MDLKGPGSVLEPDGRDDLALIVDMGPDEPGRLQLLVNDGQGGLGSENIIYDVLPASPRCLATGDVDGDGDDDAVVGSASGNAVVLLRNNGAGQLVAEVPVTAVGLPLSVTVVPPLTALHGTEAGGFGVGTAGAGGGDVGQSILTLYNSQGVELASVSLPTTPTTTTTRGRRVLTGGASSTTAGGSSGLPGRIALVEVGPSGSLLVSDAVDVGGLPEAIDVADIDGDGLDEVVVANAEPQFEGAGTALPVLCLIRATEAGLGGAVPIAPVGLTAGRDVVLLDADSDGILDIVAIGDSSGGQTAALTIDLNGEAGGTLTVGTATAIDSSRPSIAARGDLDGVGGRPLPRGRGRRFPCWRRSLRHRTFAPEFSDGVCGRPQWQWCRGPNGPVHAARRLGHGR